MNPNADLNRVRQLLGAAELQPLVRKLDRRLAKNPSIEGYVTINDPPLQTREAITSLLGSPPKSSGSLRVKLAALDDVIRESGAAPGLIEAMKILLNRPPRHPAIENRRLQAQWQNVHRVIERPEEIPGPAWDYLQAICRDGVLRRAARGSLERAEKMLRQLAQCAAALPADEPTPLPVFATRQLGDAHALDADRPLRSLLLRTIDHLFAPPTETTGDETRRRWSRVNLVPDELSSSVLVLNLPVAGDGLLDRMLRDHAAHGEPCRLTFRQLRLHPVTPRTPLSPIHVCENPSVLAAAATELADRCRPLICVEGQPSHAATQLLTRLRATGAELRYHGDFDRAGLQITAQMVARFDAVPWRMSRADYLQHCDLASLDFEGKIPDTHWDETLSAAIEVRRKVVLEENTLEQLLRDLDAMSPVHWNDQTRIANRGFSTT